MISSGTILNEAIRWHDLGLSPIPLLYGSKTPQKRMKWTRHWEQQISRKMLLRILSVPAYRNLGVIIKPPYVVIDFDDLNMYNSWAGPETWTVSTGRGMHAWFQIAETPPLSIQSHTMGGEVIANRHLVTVPPSIHKSGKRYGVAVDAPIAKVESLKEIGIELEEIIETDTEPVSRRPTGSTFIMPTDYSPKQSLIEQIKDHVTIYDLLSQFGISVKNGACRCPLHQDKNPSMVANATHAKCMKAGCRGNYKRMDVIDLAEQLYGCDTKEAIRRLT